VAAILRVQYPHLWDEYDQLRSEAEFRYSVVPPLVLIVLVGALTWTPLAVLLLIVPAVLAWQGFLSEQASINSIMDVIDAGIVTPPVVEALHRLAAEERETERTPAPDGAREATQESARPSVHGTEAANARLHDQPAQGPDAGAGAGW
jgi:hypothetical protein